MKLSNHDGVPQRSNSTQLMQILPIISSSSSDQETILTPSLIQLHWLPVASRVQYKLCPLMHYVHTGRDPSYLINRCKRRPPERGVKACDQPRRQTMSFRYCARSSVSVPSRTLVQTPAAWNVLPADLRQQTVSFTFKKQLKTLFFKSAFNIN